MYLDHVSYHNPTAFQILACGAALSMIIISGGFVASQLMMQDSANKIVQLGDKLATIPIETANGIPHDQLKLIIPALEVAANLAGRQPKAAFDMTQYGAEININGGDRNRRR